MNDKNKNNSHSAGASGPKPGNTERRRSDSAGRPHNAAENANPRKKKKKKHSKAFLIFKKIVTVIMTTLLSLFLVMIITGTIVCTALTVYVLDFMEETTGITLQELESGSNTYFYTVSVNKETGEEEYTQIHAIHTAVQRIPVSIDQIPQHVRDTFVYTEDERFYTHDGVDYKRTFSAFLNMFLHIYDTDQGGSTITQQLVKNLTGDDEKSPSRKIREIFRAMQLEKTYSKDEILEEYLNYIGFGGPINGIQLAANRYFGKNVDELTTAEAATLAAIPKSPNYYQPVQEFDDETGEIIFDGRANNKERQQYVLWQVYKNGAITYDEYQQCLDEKLIYTDSEEYLATHPEDAAKELERENQIYSWVVDAIYDEATDYLMDQFNIGYNEALSRINSGGYKIYATVDTEMQEYVENKFLDLGNLLNVDSVRRYADLDGDGNPEEYLPHVAFTALRYDGSVMATVGNVGEKTDSLINSYAKNAPRQIGSTIKPISTYGLALETDLIHWGSKYRDEAIMELDGRPWPTNYSTDGNISISGETREIYYFLQKSYNTVPAQLCEALTPNAVYNFCIDKLGMKLDPADEGYSPLTVGALTYGITLENLVNAYIPYGNNGIYNEAHIISKIEQGTHNVIYENNGNPRQAVSAETAWVMNRLLKNVVDNGTGTAAKLSDKVVCGKTGTTDNWYNLTFVGLTPDFVSGITIGYEYNDQQLKLPTSLKSAQVWLDIIGEYANSIQSNKDFEPVDGVIEAPMCTISGMIAGQNCPKGITGYWKSSNAPVCTGGHYVAPEPTTNENGQPVTDAPTDPNAQTPTQASSDPNAQQQQPTDPNAQTPQEPQQPASEPETPQSPEEPQQPAEDGGEAPA